MLFIFFIFLRCTVSFSVVFFSYVGRFPFSLTPIWSVLFQFFHLSVNFWTFVFNTGNHLGLPPSFCPCSRPSSTVLTKQSCRSAGPIHLFCLLLSMSRCSFSCSMVSSNLAIFFSRRQHSQKHADGTKATATATAESAVDCRQNRTVGGEPVKNEAASNGLYHDMSKGQTQHGALPLSSGLYASVRKLTARLGLGRQHKPTTQANMYENAGTCAMYVNAWQTALQCHSWFSCSLLFWIFWDINQRQNCSEWWICYRPKDQLSCLREIPNGIFGNAAMHKKP